jgi:hypothetical protein
LAEKVVLGKKGCMENVTRDENDHSRKARVGKKVNVKIEIKS